MSSDNVPQTVSVVRAQLERPEVLSVITQTLPSGSDMSAERYASIAVSHLMRQADLARCSPTSILRCIRRLAQTGLALDGRQAHIVRYGDAATLVIDYKGYVELAYRSGRVRRVHADVVCDGDEWEENLGQVVRHVPARRKPRGAPYAAYALIELVDGSQAAAILSWDEIHRIKQLATARLRNPNQSPWYQWEWEMAKKTCFRRLSKWIRLSPEQREAEWLDNEEPPAEELTQLPARTITLSDITDALPADDVQSHPPDDVQSHPDDQDAGQPAPEEFQPEPAEASQIPPEPASDQPWHRVFGPGSLPDGCWQDPEDFWHQYFACGEVALGEAGVPPKTAKSRCKAAKADLAGGAWKSAEARREAVMEIRRQGLNFPFGLSSVER